uniref:Uncharacterized protein n=1 Tax=Anguilla anguilla TaxID=7936 RepID=A0A0E9Q177_ANGAN
MTTRGSTWAVVRGNGSAVWQTVLV